MYYEEKFINGTLCCRYDPDGAWIPLSLAEVNKRINNLLIDISGTANEMEREAVEFDKCGLRHKAPASAVAGRASEILMRFVSKLRSSQMV